MKELKNYCRIRSDLKKIISHLLMVSKAYSKCFKSDNLW